MIYKTGKDLGKDLGKGERSAWYWAYQRCALFVGIDGKEYPNSKQVQLCTVQSASEACDVFTRQISPYAARLIPLGTTPFLYFKQVFNPPLQTKTK